MADRDEPLEEWDYLPPVGPRPTKGFVGLKNAGATCYMNSVLQQLYMVESIRVGLLAAEGATTDLEEDFSGEERLEGEYRPKAEAVLEEDSQWLRRGWLGRSCWCSHPETLGSVATGTEDSSGWCGGGWG
ncbi:hypothetical protein PR048_027222 [Dryococelus australis]|uniref:Peptidase C19 ubiquitin carboxyl-terminal hydrolase domain-containing protein n=1 Tax=Dryococelus australis TaxID=614101 RepID=A0ABQ9GEU3_9NEOP|nr:hypothetical protein PR048_027222 [Dryococelus australis]